MRQKSYFLRYGLIIVVSIATWILFTAAVCSGAVDSYIRASCELPALDDIRDYMQSWNRSWPDNFHVSPWQEIRAAMGWAAGARVWLLERIGVGIEGEFIKARNRAAVSACYYTSDRLDAELCMDLAAWAVLGQICFRLWNGPVFKIDTSIGAGYYMFGVDLSGEATYTDIEGVVERTSDKNHFSGDSFGLKVGGELMLSLGPQISLAAGISYRAARAEELTDGDGRTLARYLEREKAGLDMSGWSLTGGVVFGF